MTPIERSDSGPLERPALRDMVRARLRARIVDGRLPAGNRLRDEALAFELGISRTPVREALVLLANDGLVECVHQRGFHVRSFTESEVLQVYPVTACLEALAVRSNGPYGADHLDRLASRARRMSAARGARARLAADERWHALLVERCPNTHLRGLLEQHKARIQRYELRYFRQPSPLVETSCAEHEAIRARLAEGALDEAAALVEAHWLRGMDVLLDLLRAESSSGRP